MLSAFHHHEDRARRRPRPARPGCAPGFGLEPARPALAGRPAGAGERLHRAAGAVPARCRGPGRGAAPRRRRPMAGADAALSFPAARARPGPARENPAGATHPVRHRATLAARRPAVARRGRDRLAGLAGRRAAGQPGPMARHHGRRRTATRGQRHAGGDARHRSRPAAPRLCRPATRPPAPGRPTALAGRAELRAGPLPGQPGRGNPDRARAGTDRAGLVPGRPRPADAGRRARAGESNPARLALFRRRAAARRAVEAGSRAAAGASGHRAARLLRHRIAQPGRDAGRALFLLARHVAPAPGRAAAADPDRAAQRNRALGHAGPAGAGPGRPMPLCEPGLLPHAGLVGAGAGDQCRLAAGPGGQPGRAGQGRGRELRPVIGPRAAAATPRRTGT